MVKPYVGISKNLGNGIRVGFALPMELSSKPSKREQANIEFVDNVKSLLTDALYSFYLSHGVLVSKKDLPKANAETVPDIYEKLESAEPIMTSISRSLRLYADTGSLTQQSKEKIMNDVYSFEEFVSANGGNKSGLVAAAVEAYKKKVTKLSIAPLAIALVGSMVLASAFGKAGLMLGGLFLCANAFLYIGYASKSKTEQERNAILSLCPHIITPVEEMLKQK